MDLSKQTISSLKFPEQAYFFALCSKYAYLPPKVATPLFKHLGFTAELVSNNDSQVYFLHNIRDLVIVARGTELKELADIKASLNFSMGSSLFGPESVHDGFKKSVRNVWDSLRDLTATHNWKCDVWCAGHSLGAGMSTLIAFYLEADTTMPNPRGLFTYGSPMVGGKDFVTKLNNLGIRHYRFVNNCDIITDLPPGNYAHHGVMYYMNHWGNMRAVSGWQLTKDRFRGFAKGLTKGEINYFTNHGIERYCINLERWTRGEERPEKWF